MRLAKSIFDELWKIMMFRENLPLENMALGIIEKHIGQLENSLEDVPGDTLEQKVHRIFHELQIAHERIEELDVDVPL